MGFLNWLLGIDDVPKDNQWHDVQAGDGEFTKVRVDSQGNFHTLNGEKGAQDHNHIVKRSDGTWGGHDASNKPLTVYHEDGSSTVTEGRKGSK